MIERGYVDYKLKGRPGKDYYDAVNCGLKKFIEDADAIFYNIPENEKRNYGKHIESCYLCHGIWTTIMKNRSNNGHPYSDNYFIWKNKENEEQGRYFHFEIMNNPKSCGLAKKCIDKLLQQNRYLLRMVIKRNFQ